MKRRWKRHGLPGFRFIGAHPKAMRHPWLFGGIQPVLGIWLLALVFPLVAYGQVSQEGVNFLERSAEVSNNFSLNGRYFSRSVDPQTSLEKAQALAKSVPNIEQRSDLTLSVGDLYLAAEQYSEARKLLARHLGLFPNNLPAMIMMGDAYLAEKKVSEAAEWYSMVIKKFPQTPDGYIGRMKVAEEQKNFMEAKRLGFQVLQMDPKNPQATTRLGNIFLNEKKFNEAMKYFYTTWWVPECRLGMGLAYFYSGNFKAARPLLVEAFYNVTMTEPLQVALINLSSREIAQLKMDLSSGKLDSLTLENKKNRLAFLFQAVGSCDETPEFIRALLPVNPNFDQVLRIAGLMAMAGHFEDAGKYYELAARGSPRPRVTKLAAIDCYIVARKFALAEAILFELKRQKAGYDLDQRYANLYLAKEKKEEGQRIYLHGGQFFEKNAPRSGNPREAYLAAVDNYLDGRLYQQALRVLTQLTRSKANIETDMRYARLFFEEKNYDSAIEIYNRYPLNINMQVAKGYAYLYSKRPRQAEQTFREILAKYPGYKGAKDGLASIPHIKPWDFFTLYSHVNYGALQDNRQLFGEVLRYNHRGENRAVSTVSYIRTDVISLTPGNADLNENLVGLRFYYKFDKRWAAQLHSLFFSNDDPFSNSGKVLGGTVYFLPSCNWSFGLEGNGTRWTGASSFQVNPWVQYRFDEHFKLDVEGSFTHVSGGALRASQPGNYSALNGTMTVTPVKRFVGGISVWGGTRKLNVDSTALYAYNALDLYKSQTTGFFTYNLKSWWKLFAKYSISSMVSEWQSAFNEATGTTTYNPNYTVQLISSGMDFFF